MFFKNIGGTFYSRCSIVAAAGTMSWRRCLGFVVKAKVFYLAFQKKYTTRNQWLSYIYNTVPEQYNANSREYTDICRYFNYLFILSHLLSTGRAFREKCKLHTAYNNQEIFVFELVHLKVDILNFL